MRALKCGNFADLAAASGEQMLETRAAVQQSAFACAGGFGYVAR
jgi:hypothetical protein